MCAKQPRLVIQNCSRFGPKVIITPSQVSTSVKNLVVAALVPNVALSKSIRSPTTPVNGNNYTSESYSMDDSVTAQDQEQPSSEALLPGSVSIDESYSIASPIRTPTQSVSISSLVAQDSLL